MEKEKFHTRCQK